jgi:hypothetical protein
MAARLCGPGGVRSVMAENLLLKQQLIVLRRGRRRAPSPSAPRHSWSFVRAWSVANTAGCSRQRRARRNPDRKGRTRHSSKPSSSSSRAILDSAVHGSRASSLGRSGSTSTRTSCTACWRNTIAQSRAGPDHRGCRSLDTPPTACGVWTCLDAFWKSMKSTMRLAATHHWTAKRHCISRLDAQRRLLIYATCVGYTRYDVR